MVASIGGGEAYMHGYWDCDDLVALVRLLLQNRRVLDGMETGAARFTQPLQRLFHWVNRNTHEGARRNISAHYDLGNDLYQAMLDKRLNYTCGYWQDATTLDEAQEDKLELEKKVLTNVKDLVLPYVEKLKNSRLQPKDKTLVEIIETHLQDIITPLMQNLTNANILLTPQEMQVATLVKDGKTSKEIAELLIVSEATVNFHRKNLRAKFGLTNQRTNLRTYLLTNS